MHFTMLLAQALASDIRLSLSQAVREYTKTSHTYPGDQVSQRQALLARQR